MYLTYGLLQVLQWNKNTTTEKMDGSNCCRQITDFFQYINAWNKGGILINNYDISLLQFLFCKNTVNLKECLAAFALLFCFSSNGWLQLELRINSIPWDDCKCLFQRKTVPLKIPGHCERQIMMLPLKFMATSAPLK